MAPRWIAALAALLVGACASEWERTDLEGRPCPCLPDWVCDTSRGEAGVCVAKSAGPGGAAGSDGSGGSSAAGGSGGAGLGGDGGSDADAGSTKQCPPLGEPAGGSCPSVCDECSSDICIIRCDDARACSSTTLACPAGFDCQIACSGAENCASLQVVCADGASCSTTCNGRRTCAALIIACAAGPCALSCGSGGQICKDSELHCGTGSCQASCNGNEIPQVFGCENSCSASCGC